ncbi:alpha/beta hydrolase [Gellertiella hungarica]|nr:alpha/beta hydrolase [Gellertiella hungarica]
MTGDTTAPEFIDVGTGEERRPIAIRHRPATRNSPGPALLWLSGYRSDMLGSKAVAADQLAERLGIACIRFDYSGHGESGGVFTNGTISRWLEEALAVIDHLEPEELVLIGSSMGGWIALRLAEELRRRGRAPKVKGMVLIAPAPDFTSELIEPALTDAQKRSLAERGFFDEPSAYSPEPNIFTRALIEDGRNNRVLKGIIETGCPIHILQGMQDPDVPFSHALKLLDHLPADDTVLTLIRDGDHRLSRPQDLERMVSAITELSGIPRLDGS